MRKPNYYSVAQTCELLKICRKTLYTYTKLGEIVTTKIGGRIFYNEKDIQKFLKGRR